MSSHRCLVLVIPVTTYWESVLMVSGESAGPNSSALATAQSSALLFVLGSESVRVPLSRRTVILLRSILKRDRKLTIEDSVKLRAIATTSLEHCRTLNDALGIAEASYYLGWSMSMLGELDEALQILHESLGIRRAHGDDAGVVQCLERIGNIQMAKGQRQEALSTMDEAMAIASRSGDRLGLANVLHALGGIHHELSDFVKAADALSEAITITRNVGCEGELSTNLYDMGHLKMQWGEHREAEQLLQESISIARRIGGRLMLAAGLDYLGECFRRQSKLKEAAPLLEEACLLYHELSHQALSSNIACTLVGLRSSQGDWDSAVRWHDHIIALCRGQKNLSTMAVHLIWKGRTLVKARRYDEAALHFEAAIAANVENRNSWDRGLKLLCAIPRMAMHWERRSPLLCDVKKLQRRQPQLVTPSLKLSISIGHRES
ncbi:hypothetical protein FRC01_001160 [Tulasnella sp. 417]|nr:hypothetical protein FRC01_001160 [Tulasnella sp. 417]